MNDLITRAKAYLAHPPANFPEGVILIREFVAEFECVEKERFRKGESLDASATEAGFQTIGADDYRPIDLLVGERAGA